LNSALNQVIADTERAGYAIECASLSLSLSLSVHPSIHPSIYLFVSWMKHLFENVDVDDFVNRTNSCAQFCHISFVMYLNSSVAIAV